VKKVHVKKHLGQEQYMKACLMKKTFRHGMDVLHPRASAARL